jgi:hypothetical protein
LQSTHWGLAISRPVFQRAGRGNEITGKMKGFATFFSGTGKRGAHLSLAKERGRPMPPLCHCERSEAIPVATRSEIASLRSQ